MESDVDDLDGYLAESLKDPEFAALYAAAKAEDATSTERLCSRGCCVGIFTADGRYTGGWGPVNCDHEENW